MNWKAKKPLPLSPQLPSVVVLRRGRWLGALLVVLGVPCWGNAQTSMDSAPPSVRIVTNPDDVAQLPTEEQARSYPLRLEGRVNYYDPLWQNMWFEHEGAGRYTRLSVKPPLLRNGQRVLIEGTYVPVEGLAAERVKVTVLQESAPITPVSTAGRIGDVLHFDRKVVTTEGYVDEQQLMDGQHLRLTLIVEDRRVICWVPPDGRSELPNWQRRFVRVTAVYSGRLDPTGTDTSVELWVAHQADVEELGSIETDPRFGRPPTAIHHLSETTPGMPVLVRGILQRRESGTLIVLRDRTGEVTVNSLQRERLPVGSEVEAVGNTGVSGSRWVIRSGLVRRAATAGPALSATVGPLTQVDAIRQLSLEEAARGQLVEIAGCVTWSLPGADCIFLQDFSGGVRVQVPPGTARPPLQKFVRVVGRTCRGAFAPEVRLQEMHDLGSMAHPAPKLITYAQAITGLEDGQWVEMRGFIRRTTSEGDWRRIYVTTPEGEFVGRLQSPVNFVATPGSLLRVRGVCEVTTDSKGHIDGVQLRVPFLHDITIEEDAPAELYGLPVRSLSSLRQLVAMQDMARAHILGKVVHHVAGQYLVVQEGDTGLIVYSREPGQLASGDVVEAVGILGREGARMVLREAVFRRVRTEAAPKPTPLPDPATPDSAYDLRLVQVRGTLLDFSRHAGRMQFAVQSGTAIFDVALEGAASTLAPQDFVPGIGLDLTGIYRVVFDDFNRPRGFQLQLRTRQDLSVYAPARFWTVPRALLAVTGLGTAMLLVIVWGAVLRHRVRVQTEQIRRQVEKQASLEGELERAQRFRSLGLLAGGLAHDFNNLLTGILGNVTLAMLEEKVMPLVGDCLRDIEMSARRARDLTQQLVTFAKGGDPLRDTLPLPELLHNVVGFAFSGSSARAALLLPPDLWPVHADRNQLGRALQNLLVHARGAMPEGGVVAVEGCNETLAAQGAGTLGAGRYVRLTIIDHGPGLSLERLAGFFDPYAATKFGDDRFSLAIAYSIIKRHNGHLEVESTPGVGTTFRLWVPAAEMAVEIASPIPAADRPTVDIAGTRVLLMDDEETIRRLGERLLQRLKCHSRTVADGETCLQAYREALAAGRRYDVVILDLTVPGGMGGRECIAELLKLDPTVQAIVSSGYSNDPVMANHRAHGFVAVVPKPYTVSAMAGAIQSVVGASR